MQPNYVRVSIKGKIFQMALKDEVRIDESSSKRSQVTGKLLIIMPKLNATNTTGLVANQSAKKSIKKEEPKGTVSIRNIVIDESEIPPLI